MKKQNRTRCPECWIRLEFTDNEQADDIISKHLNIECDK